MSQIQVQLYHVMVAVWTLMSAESFDIAFDGNACSHVRGVTFAHIILVLSWHRGPLRAKVMVGRFMRELSRHDS